MLTRVTNLFSGGKKQKLASWLLIWVLLTWWLALVLGSRLWLVALVLGCVWGTNLFFSSLSGLGASGREQEMLSYLGWSGSIFSYQEM